MTCERQTKTSDYRRNQLSNDLHSAAATGNREAFNETIERAKYGFYDTKELTREHMESLLREANELRDEL